MGPDPFRLLGTTLAGKYQVDRTIGEGGFGVVYAGTHLHLGTPVAIKCLKGATSAMVHSLVREARLLFGLTHPGIVRMYDAGDHMGVPYVVLELVEGFPLDQEIERRRLGQAPPMTAQEIGEIIGSVLDALAYAHARGVVHGDLKPSNVMVARQRSGESPTKILDFGTALVKSGSAITGGVGLTPRYAAPEQWEGSLGKVSPATDLFAIGLVLEEMATCHNLVQGDTVQQLLANVMAPKQSMIRARRPDLPPALEDVVMRAVQIRPQDRFGSAAELATAVRTALAGGRPSLPASSLPVSTLPSPGASPMAFTSGAPPIAITPAPPAPAPTPALPAPPPKKSSNAGCIIVSILLLLLFLGGAATAGLYLGTHVFDSPDKPQPSASTIASSPPLLPTTSVTATTPSAQPLPSSIPSIVRPTSTSTSTSTSTGTSTSTSTTTRPTRALVFDFGTGAYGGLYPNATTFLNVANTNGPNLKVCFDNEHLPDAWSAIVVVRFTKDGGRSMAPLILHEGTEEHGGVAQRLIDCFGSISLWPWPKPTQQGFDDLDGGLPYVRMTVGYHWKAL